MDTLSQQKHNNSIDTTFKGQESGSLMSETIQTE